MSQITAGLGQILELDFLIEIPDDTFKLIYKDLVGRLYDEMNGGMEELIIQILNSEEYHGDKAKLVEDIEQEKQMILDLYLSKGYILSPEKIQFVTVIFDFLADALKERVLRQTIGVAIQLLEGAKMPTYAHDTDACADIYAYENVDFHGGETVAVRTGIKLAIPEGYMIDIRPRSGMSFKTSLRIANAPGTIDSGYRDELKVILTNIGTAPYQIVKGDRIAQMIIMPCPMIEFIPVDDILTLEGNREGGLGSTGV